MRLLTDFRRDLGLGVRLLARFPGFTAVSIVTLAIAIGGNTAVFTIVNALLLTPAPVVEPARLARVHTGQSLASWPTYEDVRDRSDAFTGVAASRLAVMALSMGGTTARLRGEVTSLDYLTVLGVPAELGRTYAAGESAVDRVVLAHHLWRGAFGGDPAVVGRSVTLGGRSMEIVGVMPAGFRGVAPPGFRLDFWLPVDPRREAESLQTRLAPQFQIVGRLRPGIGHAAATAGLRALAGHLRTEHPELPESLLAIEAVSIQGVGAFQGMASMVIPLFAFLALLGIVSAFVLVIGCSNIAGLLLGRNTMRQRELAVRLSLGSSRGRLLRQLLTESLVVAVAGGAAGVLVALLLVAGIRAGVAALPFPLDLPVSLDWRVAAYAVALSTASALFFGLLPARSALRVDLLSALKAESSGSPDRQRLRRLMVTGQVAACAALVAWSLLFLRSLGHVHDVQPGFEPAGVVLATVELDRGSIDPERGERILTEWAQRVGTMPGVQSAALATVVPLALFGREDFGITLPGDPDQVRHRVVASRVSPGWFTTVRVPLTAGRDFTWDDRPGTPAVAIVNETLAHQLWHGRAVGRRVMYGTLPLEVVGIARDSKYLTLGESPRPLIYLPLRQHYLRFVSLHARATDLRTTGAAAADALRQIVPGASVEVQTMSDAVAVAVLPARIGATATGIFGLLAVMLATFGVYGLVSFSVLQRAREIGIRRAIGATAADVVRLVVRHHAVPIGAGLAIGLTTGTLGAVALRSFLTGIGPADPLALLGTAALVAGAAVTATVVPAVRATRLDPIAAVREP
jgi:putative ABC transport system permease protein